MDQNIVHTPKIFTTIINQLKNTKKKKEKLIIWLVELVSHNLDFAVSNPCAII